MKIVIIYDIVPEELLVFQVEDAEKVLSESEIQMIKNAHGQIVNVTDEQDAALELNELLVDERLEQYKIDYTDLDIKPFENVDLLVISGFVT